jgi:hypothetical protein
MYRTKTYIAGDWDHDNDAVVQLHKWNESDHWGLSFKDVHELTQSRDSSLNCSIKASLKKRMDVSKLFILIVGESTNTVTAGGCQYCQKYNATNRFCSSGMHIDYRSYIKYECDKALEAGISIVVLYKSTKVDRDKCPETVRYSGVHVPMYFSDKYNILRWNYQGVKQIFDRVK